MAEVENQFVKHGFWINTAEGPNMGRTITTDVRTGIVVIALLAVLVALTTSHLWSLFVFGIHQLRTGKSSGLADGLFRQQQLLLRTSSSPDSFLVESVKLWWLWRRKVKNALARSVVQSLAALLFFAATIISGIFSSYVVNTTNLQVLVDSSECAILDVSKLLSANSATGTHGFMEYVTSVRSRTDSYFQSCYRGSSSAPPSRCNIFIKPNVSLAHTNTDCPFDKSICMDSNGTFSPVSVDSGQIDANDIFGWNLGRENRLKYRKRTTCAILKTEGHVSTVNASALNFLSRKPYPGEQLLVVSYGTKSGLGEWGNATFTKSLVGSNVTAQATWGSIGHHSNPVWNDLLYEPFNPFNELQTSDGDLQLLLVGKNLLSYNHPVDDPLFSAHQNLTYNRAHFGAATLFFSDDPISMLGCKYQYQFCFARRRSTSYCTELAGLPDPKSVEDLHLLGASDVQVAGIQLLARLNHIWELPRAAQSGLDVNNKLYDPSGTIDSLPDDQWIREIVRLEGLIWAALQTLTSDFAIGVSVQSPALDGFMRRNLTTGERKICKVQRMRKVGGLVNINVLALAFVITVSCIVTLLDLAILKYFIFIQRWRKALSPGINEWIQNGVYQLQWRIYEAYGERTWERTDTEIPITSTGELLSNSPWSQPCTHTCHSHSRSDPATNLLHTQAALPGSTISRSTSGTINDVSTCSFQHIATVQDHRSVNNRDCHGSATHSRTDHSSPVGPSSPVLPALPVHTSSFDGLLDEFHNPQSPRRSRN